LVLMVVLLVQYKREQALCYCEWSSDVWSCELSRRLLSNAGNDKPSSRWKVYRCPRSRGGAAMDQTLSIGQVARTTGVAETTIRYYEAIGVLPMPSRAASGFRRYDQPGVERLRFVRRARALGLPLQE